MKLTMRLNNWRKSSNEQGRYRISVHLIFNLFFQGYFSANLLLRRECDKVFVTLLEMGKFYGRNPFAIHHDSPPPPPILVVTK